MYPNAARIVGGKNVDIHGMNYTYFDGSDDWCVSVGCWITNHSNNNWPRSSYGIDEYLPIKMFYGKKEGDSITFEHKGKEVKLILSQTKYKYRSSGNFHDLLLSLIKSQGGLWNPSGNEPSKEEQRKMLQTGYDEYRLSII